MGKMEIVVAYPPNYEAVVKQFPNARRAGTIFAFGDKIYNPSDVELSRPILVHEATHGIRQREIGVDFWWEKYLTDARFRYHEELLAHIAEYRAMIEGTPNRNQRRLALKAVATRLASPLYGVGGGWKRHADEIKKGVPKDD